MKEPQKELPLAPLERLLRKSGAKRVSKSALLEFANVISDYVKDLSSESMALAKHAGRKTILDVDVRLARKKLS